MRPQPRPSVRLRPLIACAPFALLLAAAPAQAHNGSLLAPPPGEPVPFWTSAVVAKARAAVVHLAVEVNNGSNVFPIERASTGIAIDPTGLVVTWWDLVREADHAADKHVVVQLDPAQKALPAAIVAHDDGTQLALLQVELPAGAAAPALALGRAPLPGAPVLVLACPEKEQIASAGVATPALAPTTMHGKAAAPASMVLTDARIDERCHGAALLDERGDLVGICNSEHVHREVQDATLADLKATNFGFALSADAVRAFRAEFERKKPKNATLLAPPPAPAAPKEGIAAAVAAIAPAVVGVRGSAAAVPDLGSEDPYGTRRRDGTGSGVVVSRTGLVLTNRHLLGDREDAKVLLADGRVLPAKVVKAHAPSNLALLQVELPAGAVLAAARCGDGQGTPGEVVVAVGRPLGGKELTVSAGVLSALRDRGRLQADPNLGNQNGGGALVDATGTLLGIVDAGKVDAVDLHFMMEGDRAKTETNLAFCPGLQAVRKTFADELESAAADETIRTAPAATAAELAQRRGAYAQAVLAAAPSMLNIYVSRSARPVDDDTETSFGQKKPQELEGESLGSGVIIDASGLAVTNWHVVDSSTESDGSMRKDHAVRARSFDGHAWSVQVLSISREDDLALVQLQLADGEHCTPVVLGDSTALQVGDAVVAIGNPLGLASSVTAGIVVDKDQGIHVKRHFDKLHMLETDAAINGGNSGGGLVDLRGRLVGINSAGSSGLQNRGYAIPVDHVRHQILSLLLSPEKLRSPSLGMEVVDQDGTVRVAKVATGGPAERAGVHQGDRVLRLQGQAIDWSPAFALTLMRQPTDAPSKLALERDGVPLELQVEVLTASQWAVVRQSGLELADLPFAADPKLVQDAATALQRRFTGDGNAVPTEFPEQVVRVRRLHPRLQAEKVDVQPGDLLLAVDLEHTTTAGDATALRRFGKVQDVQALFNDRNLGSYEGTKFRCWLYRAGAITVVEIEAKRLMP